MVLQLLLLFRPEEAGFETRRRHHCGGGNDLAHMAAPSTGAVSVCDSSLLEPPFREVFYFPYQEIAGENGGEMEEGEFGWCESERVPADLFQTARLSPQTTRIFLCLTP